MKEDKIYMLRKTAVMITCMVIFITVGLVVVNFQSNTVTIDYYGEVIQVTTMSNTVEGMLMQNGIYIDEKAIVYPSKDNRIIKNMEIKIYSEDESAKLDINKYINLANSGTVEKLIQEVSYINYEKTQKNNPNIARGTTNVIKKGEAGEKIILYTVQYKENKEIAKTIISETVKKDPVEQVIEVGTKVSTVSRSSTKRISKTDLTVDNGFVKYNIKLSEDLQKYTYNMCKKYGVPYTVFLGVMYVESGYNVNAKSSTGYGICQVNPSNISYLKKKIGTTNLMDPYQNIQAGVYWLSRYYSSWSGTKDSEEKSLHALNSYNWGEGRYRSYLKKGNDAYSWYYGKKVLNAANKISANGGL